MTIKLYEQNSYETSFEATVVSCKACTEGYEVVLDRTCFFPEGGGQPGDSGMLGIVTVSDTQERGDDVLHICSGPLEPGRVVKGQIDWQKRRANMRKHTGEHILSGLICHTYDCSNIGFHMGKDYITADFSRLLNQEELRAAEKMANEAVMANIPVKAWYPSIEELDSLDYRSKKEIDGAVRIVEIPGVDCCACCGTHTATTGEVGLIRVLESEHYKSGIRVTFEVGAQALDGAMEEHRLMKETSALLSVPAAEVPEAVGRLKEQLAAMKQECDRLKGQILTGIAERVEDGTPLALYFCEGFNSVEVRKLADAMGNRAVLAGVFCGNEKEGYRYVVCSRTMDVSAIGKRFHQILTGRGGGKNPMIQGTVTGSEAEIRAFFEGEIK